MIGIRASLEGIRPKPTPLPHMRLLVCFSLHFVLIFFALGPWFVRLQDNFEEAVQFDVASLVPRGQGRLRSVELEQRRGGRQMAAGGTGHRGQNRLLSRRQEPARVAPSPCRQQVKKRFIRIYVRVRCYVCSKKAPKKFRKEVSQCRKYSTGRV